MPSNEYGQQVGSAVPGWTPRPPLAPVVLTGSHCRLEPLTPEHAPALYAALVTGSPGSLWTYLGSGPFTDQESFGAYVTALAGEPAMTPVAVVVDGQAMGFLCWMRVDRAHGSAEVGNIALGAALARTTAATEAVYLMLRHVFEDLGYRRYEWKCDALNAPSRRAAERFGFGYEGTFRQAVVYKGRSRDTAWFAITDRDWPALRAAYDAWLDPANFDAQGHQRTPLRARRPDDGTLVSSC